MIQSRRLYISTLCLHPSLGSTVPEGRHVGQKHEDYDDETEELVGDVRMGLL
jgi:hypothetical protein